MNQDIPKPRHAAMTDFGISESGPVDALGIVNSRKIFDAFEHSSIVTQKTRSKIKVKEITRTRKKESDLLASLWG